MITILATAETAVIIIAFRRILLLKESKKKIILNLICVSLLGFNIIRYFIESKRLGIVRIPVEFSAVSYFLVPLIILLKNKLLRVWAAYSGILAGAAYLACAVIFGEVVYKDYAAQKIAASMLCHGLLFLIGLIVAAEREFSFYSRWVITGGLVYTAARTIMLKNRFSGGNGIFIYELLFAYRPIKIFGKNIIPFYYLALLLLIIISFALFYNLNKRLIKNRS